MPKETQGPTTKPKTTRTSAPVKAAPTRVTGGADALIQRAKADPASLSAQEVVQLQRQLGNSAVKGLLNRSSISAPASTAVQRAPAMTAEAEEEQLATETGEPALDSAALGAPDTARPSGPPDDEDIQRKAAA